jgi:hypothetical protein
MQLIARRTAQKYYYRKAAKESSKEIAISATAIVTDSVYVWG